MTSSNLFLFPLRAIIHLDSTHSCVGTKLEHMLVFIRISQVLYLVLLHYNLRRRFSRKSIILHQSVHLLLHFFSTSVVAINLSLLNAEGILCSLTVSLSLWPNSLWRLGLGSHEKDSVQGYIMGRYVNWSWTWLQYSSTFVTVER